MVLGEEGTEVLNELGLTVLEAKIYLKLLQSQQLDVKKLASNAQLDRSDTYRVLAKLMQKGLVEKKLTNPATYMALNLLDGIRILQEHENEAKIERETKIQNLLFRSNENKGCNQYMEQSNYLLISNRRTDLLRFQDAVSNARESISGIINWNRLSNAFFR